MKRIASLLATLALVLLAVPTPGLADQAYSVVMSGTVKGELNVAIQNKRERRATFRFEDRGRGPDLVTTSRFDRRGILESFTVEGVDYAKRAVSERFSVHDGQAEWTSGADSGTHAAGAFYLASESNSEDMAALARALLAARGHELALLPAGRARIEKVLDHKVTAEKRSATATLYLISGLDLQPAAIWLDAERELFAAGGNWLGLVRKGFEPAWAELLGAQDQALDAAAERRDGKLRRRPERPLVIRNANLFDAENRRMRANVSVVVRGARIEALGDSATLEVPKDAEIIDARGAALLPGLWDMHVHLLDRAEGVLDLLAGVTSVRDMGNDVEGLQKLTQSFDDGSRPGPWVLKAGLIEGPGQFPAPIGILAQTAAQVRDAVNLYADHGYAQIKLYSSLPPDLVGEAVATAHARGLRVSGHVPAGMTMREAVMAGFDEVQHANFWFLNFMPPEVVAKTNTPVRFSAVYEHGRELDLSSPATRDFISLLVARKTVVDPTLVVFENMFTGWKGNLAPWMAPWVERLPPTAARDGRSGGRATTAEQRVTYTESFTRMKQMLKALHDAGVPIVPGTDGGALQFSRELELYVEAGIPAADVLYIATLGAAHVMGKDGEVGSITPGKRADLVLLDGDPVQRIGDVRKTRLVMKGGDLYDSAALAAAAGLTAEPSSTPRH